MIEKCPNCNSKLHITSYRCHTCNTEIIGDFKPDKFQLLTQEEKDLIELFLIKRGSIKSLAEKLQISYPTARNKLDHLVEKLGGVVEEDNTRQDILKMLNDGEISVEDAKELLKECKDE